MASEPRLVLQTHAQSSEPYDEDNHHDDEREIENLQSCVNQMAQKIVDYRTKLPDQLKDTLAAVLAAQRPVVVTDFGDGSEPGSSTDPNPGRPIDSGNEEDHETAKKIELLKRKISSNVSAMRDLLKNMKECTSKIDELKSYNVTIRPVFKRKRTS